MSDRRFADREVALVLRRAVELERESPSGATTKGVSLEELQDIAREVGIDPGLVTRAVEQLDGRGGLEPLALLGPPDVRRETRALPADLSKEQVRELIRIVDDTVSAQGSVTEALDAVRWNATGRKKSTRVSLEPGESETTLHVEERYADHIRAVCHLVPLIYGLMGGLITAANMGLTPVVMAGGALLGGATGYGLGAGLWRVIAHASAKRVRSLANKLAEAAGRMLPGGRSEPEEAGEA